MKHVMILGFALPLALAIAGAAMIGVMTATAGDVGDAAPQGAGIAETMEYFEDERFTIGEDSCWTRTDSLFRDAPGGVDESLSATDADLLASGYIRICNFEDRASVTTVRGSRERVTVGEGDCWTQTTVRDLGLIAPHSELSPGANAEMPGGWSRVQLANSIRFCHSGGDLTVIVGGWSSSRWIPNVVPGADALAA